MTNRKTVFAALAALALLASPALAEAGGNGHSNGGGHSGGNGNGNGGAHGNSGAAHGKSSSARGQVAKATTDTMTTVDKKTKVSSLPKEKNLHAKLGRLNSLQRNVNAYMNSKSRKFAALQAFVTQSAKAKVAQTQLDALNSQLDALTSLTPDQIAAMTPEEQAALPGQISALQDQIAAQQEVVDAAAVGTDPATLDAALTDMANKPVDAEVTAWAQGVLAGKIDETAAAMQPTP
ncbi:MULTISPECIES: hypothetical protein [unclassified Mesorhizobium]|uniref:hypothetical protein n=1 Tax=unclassified Mesorhizobium TaxID=325217 RepID=UPI0011268F68|nr:MULTISPECIES: hypothetical protein [unclassified Mesorhizobium]MBZ9893165.1 hypothetical protein [Mesorhizobium sp. BR1-1-6]MCA0056377.1 hypothetical protein [Mesorhizobium sp. B261B1A]TPJ51034.1 hypothetical protein FJ426_22440 [Mesorhizobium sp. B2-6-4]TPL13555.1 hypothetical protein FJ944_06810 [Mesorhizobium sp. B2-4-11]TPN03270.1 hypothetical protein FJ966_02490 [Mesorhizobium sp. B2-1-5]